MIIVKSPEQCDLDDIYFTDAIHNAANNSTFSRVVSTDSVAALNGLYIKLPLHKARMIESGDRANIKCVAHYNVDRNTRLISTIQALETGVLALYAKTFNVMDKSQCFHITDTLMSGTLRLGCEQHHPDAASASACAVACAGDDPDTASLTVDEMFATTATTATATATATTTSENIILKISGVWETDKTVGITFKYIVAVHYPSVV
jgi:hypothetical protein